MNQPSVFLIPIVAMLIPIVAIIAGAYATAARHRAKADIQMAMIARGVPLAEIEAFQQRTPSGGNNDRSITDPMRSLGNARRTATVLISLGIGLIVFFLVFGAIFLTHIDHEAGWVFLAISGTGLIPLAIGIGFLFDYNLQKREMSRFGLEVAADRS